MKRYLTWLAAVLACVCLTMQVAASEAEPTKDRVVDDADLLTDEQEADLEQQYAEISERHQFDLVVVTTYDTEGKSSPLYADDYFDYNGYGYGEKYDGALLLVNMEAGEWYVSTCGAGLELISDYALNDMAEKFVPHMNNGDFYTSFATFATESDLVLAQCGMEEEGSGEVYGTDSVTASEVALKLVIGLVIGLVAALIPMRRLKKQMRTVGMKAAAADYVKPGTCHITKSRDAFLYSNVIRVPKPKDKDSGGFHIGSSGRSHGGGGGRF